MAQKRIVLRSLNRTEQDVQVYKREDIILEKGVALTEQYLTDIQQLLERYMNFFTAYPDLYLDIIAPTEAQIKLFPYQRVFLRAIMRFKNVYVTACLKGDTPILTERGMVPIKDFNVNDKVWSDGRWRKVENLNRQNWNGNLVRLKADNCLEDTITITDDHKFLVIPRKKNTNRPGHFWKEGLEFFKIHNYEDRKNFYRINLREVIPEWVEAKNLTKNDYLLSKIDLYEKDIPYLDAPKAPARTVNFIKDRIILNNDFYEWLGIWLAEGSWRKSEITFTIGLQERRLANRIQQLTKSVFNLSSTIYEREEHNTQIIQINSAHLNVFLEKLFNTDSTQINQWNKWVPSKLLHCAPDKQLQLVKGWLDGDGYYRISGNSHRYKGTSVSNQLIEGVKFILYRNFINPSITTEIRPNKAKVYNLNFNGPLAKEFEDAINEERPVVIQTSMRLGEYYPRKVGTDFYMINKVSEITLLPPDNEDVWCLQLENGTFNVNGVEGHNCRAFSKSFITILGMVLQCIFMPGTKRFICAPNKNQAAQIAKEKLTEIFRAWPLLRKEIIGGDLVEVPGNYGKDYVTLRFRNGSQFDVVGALESSLGGRRQGGLLDEIKLHDEEMVNTVVLPWDVKEGAFSRNAN